MSGPNGEVLFDRTCIVQNEEKSPCDLALARYMSSSYSSYALCATVFGDNACSVQDKEKALETLINNYTVLQVNCS